MKVLFVCLGNICRSPAAEGVFRKMISDHSLTHLIEHDSCGTGGWHEGEPPDGRMIEHAKSRGYDLTDLTARQIRPEKDFDHFDLILTMDDSNATNVRNLTKNQKHLDKIKAFTSFCKIHEVSEVPDPYHKDDLGFELVLDMLEDGCEQLVLKLKGELS